MPNAKPCSFWLVWNPNGYPPRYRHETKQSAEDEARRLAACAPGQEFYVLAPECRIVRADLFVERFSAHVMDDVPF